MSINPQTAALPDPGPGDVALLCAGLEKAPFGAIIASTDPGGRCTYANEEFTAITGYTLRDVPTVAAWIAMAYPDPAYRQIIQANWDLDVAPGNMRRDVVYEVTCRDGSTKSVQLRANLLGEKSMIVVLLDVTARERMLHDLRVRNLAMDSCLSALAFADSGFHITYANPAFAELWGYGKASRLLGRTMAELYGASATGARPFEALRADGRWVGEIRGCRPDGSTFPAWASTSVVKDGQGQPLCFVVCAMDLTERQAAEQEHERMQERLRLSERMEAIGQLAGGVAHDFNNLLIPILGNAKLLQEAAEPASEEAILASQIQAAGAQAAELTRKLLTFARRGPRTSAPVDLHHVVRSVLDLLGRFIDRGIELATDLQAGHPWTVGDEAQVQSALLNLGLNARDAMPQGGRLSVATRDVHVAAGESRLENDGVTPGDYVEIRVSDTGMGIPESVRPRIFEPFFTTKGPGKGTGLGLASVYGCVKGHGGGIAVASRAGAGTTFTLLLPRYTAVTSHDSRPREAAPPIPAEAGVPMAKGP